MFLQIPAFFVKLAKIMLPLNVSLFVGRYPTENLGNKDFLALLKDIDGNKICKIMRYCVYG